MPVVGTHRNFVIWPASASPMQFFFHQSPNDAHHIGTAIQMLRFMKRSMWLPCHLSKVRKVNASAEFLSHAQQIVVGSRSKRPHAKRQTVCQRVASSEDRPHIRGC